MSFHAKATAVVQSPNVSQHVHVLHVPATHSPMRMPHGGGSHPPQQHAVVGRTHQQAHVDPAVYAMKEVQYFKWETAKGFGGEEADTHVKLPGPKLPADYMFGDKDVCSGRGKKHWNLPGNLSLIHI